MTAQHDKDMQDAIIRNRHSSGVDRFVSKDAAEIYRLREALKKYGRHSKYCPYMIQLGSGSCNCGFSEALAKADKP